MTSEIATPPDEPSARNAEDGCQQMKQRVLTALVGVPLIAAATWLGYPWFPALVAVIAMLASHEFFRMARGRAEPLATVGLAWTGLLAVSPLLNTSGSSADIRIALMTAMVLLSLSWLVIRRRKEDAIHGWAWTLAGVVYSGLLLSFLVALRAREDGLGWTFLAILTTFAADTGAFFAGRAFGRRKLAPAISPGKTWEGLAGGLVAAAIASAVLTAALRMPLATWHAVAVGLLIGVAATLGDLTESLIKRNFGVKDSERWLPGHGGILDRFDSLIFSAPVVYFYVVVLEMMS